MGATMNFPKVWNLDRVFEGGSRSSSFQKSFQTAQKDTDSLEKLLQSGKISEAIALMQTLGMRLREMDTFVYGLLSQNVEDTHANVLIGQMRTLQTHFSNCSLIFDTLLKEMPEDDFKSLLQNHASITFSLGERRKRALEKLSTDEESFINNLSMDGYHGWSEMWDAIVGEMSFPFQGENLYFGQIENKMSDPSREVREQAFNAIEQGFTKKQSSISQALNHLSGFRLQVYKKRGWNDFLKEPLDENRQSKSSLMAMWETIKKNQASLTRYFDCKAHLLGVDQLSWIDLDAPLSTSSKEISYQEAAETILKQFQAFSPKMASFARKALENQWIEAEDRKGKRPGGYCCALPESKESRIFMTFSKTITNLYTLAHELGHAFHNEILFHLDEMVQHPTMGLAETASTMAEMIVTQAMIREEKDPKHRLILLDDHLSRATSYLLNIYARFLFETRFYEKREKGIVSHEELSTLMEASQKDAYGDALDRYHPLFWAAKIHFYCTEVPFYNFPYTFGYLFSLGIYNHATKNPNFESSYISLLEDTGRMSPENLAKKHLNADLSAPLFWQQGIDVINKDIDEFIKLSKEVSLCD
jgi:pepF/M3 family oligoendopeptidase